VRLGAYELGPEIGRGGAGSVFRARAQDGRDVAVKMLIRPTPEAVARFGRERRILSLLGPQEGFVPLIDEGESPQGPWFAMPFLGGGSLRDKLKRGPLAIDETLALARALASAMARAHGRGLVHRDLKPENVLFTSKGEPLVADLGLAKHFSREAPGASRSVSLTKDGELRGTAGYMAPEQIDSAREAGPQADVFAIGAILYECLAGHPAFEGDSITEVLARVATSSYLAIRIERPDAPRWLARAIDRALRADARARWKDAGALLAVLEAGPRGSGGAAVAVAAVVLLSAGAALFLSRGAEKDKAPASPSPAAPVVTSTAPAPRPRAPGEPPEWWASIDKEERPSLPLPRGLGFGTGRGEYVNEKDRSILLYVARGEFDMGDDHPYEKRTNERPRHAVELSAYYIGKLEVTVGQFAAFVRETSYVTVAEQQGTGHVITREGNINDSSQTEGASWRNPSLEGPTPDNHPVVQVSWVDARAYCKWAGLDLPTEAQWERAASWEKKTQHHRFFAWGDGPVGSSGKPGNLPGAEWLRFRHMKPGDGVDVIPDYEDGWIRTAPVGSFPSGASPVGALDMSGNVAEWVLDMYDIEFYSHSPRKDPVRDDVEAPLRVVRGGSFARGWACKATWRDDDAPMYRSEDLGFRVARSALR
jgi:serine/threonine-protein kinase